jgi:hypothetical protein
LIVHFVDINLEKLLEKFNDIYSEVETEILTENLEYVQCLAFLSENQIKNEDAYKKKGGQYVKYKTIPKWHHYAWDMIK